MDNIYLNVTIPNLTKEPILARFEQNRNVAIVNDMSKYEMSIIRFYIPGTLIPLLNLKEGLPYWVTIEDNAGLKFSTKLDYINDSVLNVKNEINYYETMVRMFNLALAASWVASGGVVNEIPVLFFCPAKRIFAFNIRENTMYPADLTGRKLWINYDLYLLFDGFAGEFNGFNEVDFRDFNIWMNRSVDVNEPVNNRVITYQESSNLYLWPDLQRITFISGSMMIRNEYQLGFTGVDEMIPILTDFEPIVDEEFKVKDIYQYYPQGPWRWIDMIGTGPLVKLDGAIFYQTKDMQFKPIMIPPGRSVSFKLVFRKKNKNNSYGEE